MSVITHALADNKLVLHGFLMTANLINKYRIGFVDLFKNNFINKGIYNKHLHSVSIHEFLKPKGKTSNL